MNDNTITISTEEYAELLMCRTRLNILTTYAEQKDTRHYLDSDYVALILGIQKKEGNE